MTKPYNPILRAISIITLVAFTATPACPLDNVAGRQSALAYPQDSHIRAKSAGESPVEANLAGEFNAQPKSVTANAAADSEITKRILRDPKSNFEARVNAPLRFNLENVQMRDRQIYLLCQSLGINPDAARKYYGKYIEKRNALANIDKARLLLMSFLEWIFSEAAKDPDYKTNTRMIFLKAGADPLEEISRVMARVRNDFPLEHIHSVWATMRQYEAMREDPDQAVYFVKYLYQEGILSPDTTRLIFVDTDTFADGYGGTEGIVLSTIMDPSVISDANSKFGLNLDVWNQDEEGRQAEMYYISARHNGSDGVSGIRIEAKLGGKNGAIITKSHSGPKLKLFGFEDISIPSSQSIDKKYMWVAIDNVCKIENISSVFIQDANGNVKVLPEPPYGRREKNEEENRRVHYLQRAGFVIGTLNILEAQGYNVDQETKDYFKELKNDLLLVMPASMQSHASSAVADAGGAAARGNEAAEGVGWTKANNAGDELVLPKRIYTYGRTYPGRVMFTHAIVERYLKDVDGKPLRIADVGIGSDGAPNLYELADYLGARFGIDNIKLWGIDINDEAVRQAENHLGEKYKGWVYLKKGNFADTADSGPLKNLDCVRICNVSMYFTAEEQQRAISYIARNNLREGGVIIDVWGPQIDIRVPVVISKPDEYYFRVFSNVGGEAKLVDSGIGTVNASISVPVTAAGARPSHAAASANAANSAEYQKAINMAAHQCSLLSIINLTKEHQTGELIESDKISKSAALLEIAEFLAEAGNINEAFEISGKALEINANKKAQLVISAAKKLAELGKIDEALVIFERALEILQITGPYDIKKTIPRVDYINRIARNLTNVDPVMFASIQEETEKIVDQITELTNLKEKKGLIAESLLILFKKGIGFDQIKEGELWDKLIEFFTLSGENLETTKSFLMGFNAENITSELVIFNQQLSNFNKIVELLIRENGKSIPEHQINIKDFISKHIFTFIALNQIDSAYISQICNNILTTQNPARLLAFFDFIKPVMMDDKYAPLLKSIFANTKDRDYSAAAKIFELAQAYHQTGYIKLFTELSDKISQEHLAIKDAVYLLGKSLLIKYAQNCGIEDTFITNQRIEEWDILYLSTIFVARAKIQAMGSAFKRLQDLLDSAIKSALEGRFNNFINDPESGYPMSKEVASHNRQLRQYLADLGIDVELWLSYETEESFTLHAKASELDVEPILSKIQELLRSLLYSLDSGQSQGLRNALSKIGLELNNGEGEARLTKTNGHDQSSPIKIAQQFLTEANRITFTKVLEYIANSQKASTQTKADCFRLKREIENLAETKRGFTIRTWRRNPGRDLFQGNYTNCCIALNSVLHPEAIVEYLIDQGINMVEAVDDATGRIIAQALCFIGEDENNKPVMVIDSIDILGDYRKAKDSRTDIIDRFISYITTLSEKTGCKGLYVVVNMDIGTVRVDNQDAKLIDNNLKKAGGYLWDFEKMDDQYYLEAFASAARKIYFVKELSPVNLDMRTPKIAKAIGAAGANPSHAAAKGAAAKTDNIALDQKEMIDGLYNSARLRKSVEDAAEYVPGLLLPGISWELKYAKQSVWSDLGIEAKDVPVYCKVDYSVNGEISMLVLKSGVGRKNAVAMPDISNRQYVKKILVKPKGYEGIGVNVGDLIIEGTGQSLRDFIKKRMPTTKELIDDPYFFSLETNCLMYPDKNASGEYDDYSNKGPRMTALIYKDTTRRIIGKGLSSSPIDQDEFTKRVEVDDLTKYIIWHTHFSRYPGAFPGMDDLKRSYYGDIDRSREVRIMLNHRTQEAIVLIPRNSEVYDLMDTSTGSDLFKEIRPLARKGNFDAALALLTPYFFVGKMDLSKPPSEPIEWLNDEQAAAAAGARPSHAAARGTAAAEVTRREFLRTAILGATALALSGIPSHEEPEKPIKPPMYGFPKEEITKIKSIEELYNNILEPGVEYKWYQIEGTAIYYIEISSQILLNQAFDRLSVFAESGKRSGQVLNDKELLRAFTTADDLEGEGVGHDYSIADICRFYTQAQNKNITLRPIEEKIKDDLIQSGFIRHENGTYIAEKNAAIISSTPEIGVKYGLSFRKDTIRHEYRHGLYMTEPFIREKAREIWNSLSAALQNKIAACLAISNAGVGYDSKNTDLIVNELYATLLDYSSPIFDISLSDEQEEKQWEGLEIRFREMENDFVRSRVNEKIEDDLIDMDFKTLSSKAVVPASGGARANAAGKDLRRQGIADARGMRASAKVFAAAVLAYQMALIARAENDFINAKIVEAVRLIRRNSVAIVLDANEIQRNNLVAELNSKGILAVGAKDKIDVDAIKEKYSSSYVYVIDRNQKLLILPGIEPISIDGNLKAKIVETNV